MVWPVPHVSVGSDIYANEKESTAGNGGDGEVKSVKNRIGEG